jgi:glycosyltransferase involved in cell wall biosynthesis
MWQKISKRLKAINKTQEVIGLLSFWAGECCFVAKRFATKNDLKHYCWMRGQDARKGNRYIKYIKPRANELIALSDFIAEELQRNYGVLPSHIIPNAIDTSHFPQGNYQRDIDLIGVGSLIPLKQYEIFIHCAKELLIGHPQLKCLICGKGPEEKKLQQLIEKEGLTEYILLTGELSHDEVLKLMKQSKIMLHPSSYEGYSTACLEAIYAGACVISFCKPMKKRIANWHFVQNKEEMITTAKELLSGNLPQEIPNVYTIEQAAKDLMKLYD